MGLLTDTKQRQAVIRLIVNHHAALSVLLYTVGLVWFLALAYRPFNAGTYFSENALLPGLVQSGVPTGFPSIYSYSDALKVEMSKNKNAVPKEWIFQQFENLGLSTYRHNFTVSYPFRMPYNENLRGENIYAILRSRRAASWESLVMTAPFRTASNKKTQTDGSIALMLALASLFKKNPFWAKNIIFLLTDFEEVGVHAWLEAYHETKSPYVLSDDLPARGGAIQAAINLELPAQSVRYLNIKIEGLNGQLPNLDLVNLAVRLSNREHVPAKLHHRSDPREEESVEGYQWMLQTLLRMMWSQASGAPSGNHGLFHRFHIEALTIEGVLAKKAPRAYDQEQIARVVEGIFRSLNNLLERFHQSFFFYLLPSTDRYISIGVYMPPFGLMAAAVLIKALALWIMTHTSTDETEKKVDKTEKECTERSSAESLVNAEQSVSKDEMSSSECKDEGEDPANVRRRYSRAQDAQSGGGKEVVDEISTDDSPDPQCGSDLDPDSFEHEPVSMPGLLGLLPIVLMAYLLGLLAYSAPYFLNHFSPPVRMKAVDSLYYGVLAVFTAGLAFPYLINRKAMPEEHLGGDWRLLKCVGLILEGLVLFALALLNISMAFFLAALSLPVTIAVRPTRSRLLGMVQLVALLAVSPIGQLQLAAVISTALQTPGETAGHILWQSIDTGKQMLSLLLMDQYLLTSWTYTLACFALLPTWLLFWAIPFCAH